MTDTSTLLSVNALRTVAKKHRYRAMIMVGVRDDGVVDVVSYGQSKEDCRIIGDYAQNQFGANLPVAPFQTWFGWGTGGVPTKIRYDDIVRASPKARDYITANTHPDAVEPTDG
jgi:hypothetical protein